MNPRDREPPLGRVCPLVSSAGDSSFSPKRFADVPRSVHPILLRTLSRLPLRMPTWDEASVSTLRHFAHFTTNTAITATTCHDYSNVLSRLELSSPSVAPHIAVSRLAGQIPVHGPSLVSPRNPIACIYSCRLHPATRHHSTAYVLPVRGCEPPRMRLPSMPLAHANAPHPNPIVVCLASVDASDELGPPHPASVE